VERIFQATPNTPGASFFLEVIAFFFFYLWAGGKKPLQNFRAFKKEKITPLFWNRSGFFFFRSHRLGKNFPVGPKGGGGGGAIFFTFFAGTG